MKGVYQRIKILATACDENADIIKQLVKEGYTQPYARRSVGEYFKGSRFHKTSKVINKNKVLKTLDDYSWDSEVDEHNVKTFIGEL